jgi:PAS domain S-box-containing protein
MSASRTSNAPSLSPSVSDAPYRAVFDAAFRLAILAARDGAIVDANTRALTLLQVRRDRALGAPLWDTGPWRSDPDWIRWLRAAIESASSGGVVREERLLQVGNRDVVLDLSVQPIAATGGPLVLIEGHDVTDRRRIEDALRSSEARFSGIVSLATDAIVSVDASYRIVLFTTGRNGSSATRRTRSWASRWTS